MASQMLWVLLRCCQLSPSSRRVVAQQAGWLKLLVAFATRGASD